MHWEAERFLLLHIPTQRGNVCTHGPMSGTPKCSHVFEGLLKLSLSRYINNFYKLMWLNQPLNFQIKYLCNSYVLSQIYLHREQCSLGSCYAETWLAPAVPKARREYRVKKTKNKTQSASRQIIHKCEYNLPVWFCLFGCISLWVLLWWAFGVSLYPSL